MESSSGIARAYGKESMALETCDTIFWITEDPSLSAIAVLTSLGEKQVIIEDKATAVDLRVAESVESKKFHTLFHTLLTSFEAFSGSMVWYATKAPEETWTQLEERVKSDFDGGEDSTTFKTSGN